MVNKIETKELIKLLKLISPCVDRNNRDKEELNYAFYDYDNKNIVLTDTRHLIVVRDIEIQSLNKDSFIDLVASKKHIFTVDLKGSKYPEYERIIPKDLKTPCDDIYEYLTTKNDKTMMSLFNPKFMKIMTNFYEKSSTFIDLKYYINEPRLPSLIQGQISISGDSYNFDYVAMPMSIN